MKPKMYNNARESSSDFFKNLCPVWYRDRAKLVEVFLPGFRDRQEDETRPELQPPVRRKNEIVRDGDRCFLQTTFIVKKYVNTFRSGTKCHRLCGGLRERAFVLAYLRLTARITQRAAGQAVGDYLKPDVVKELAKEFAPFLGGALEGDDIDELLGTIKNAFDNYSQVSKEVDLLLDWFGKCVGTWDVVDEYAGTVAVEVSRRVFQTEIECDDDASNQREGFVRLDSSDFLILDDDQIPALRRLALQPCEPFDPAGADRALRILLENASAQTDALVGQTRKRDNFPVDDLAIDDLQDLRTQLVDVPLGDIDIVGRTGSRLTG